MQKNQKVILYSISNDLYMNITKTILTFFFISFFLIGSAETPSKIIIKNTSLRTGKSSKSKIILRLKKGNKLVFIGDCSKYYCKVKFKKKIGWVKKHLLEDILIENNKLPKTINIPINSNSDEKIKQPIEENNPSLSPKQKPVKETTHSNDFDYVSLPIFAFIIISILTIILRLLYYFFSGEYKQQNTRQFELLNDAFISGNKKLARKKTQEKKQKEEEQQKKNEEQHKKIDEEESKQKRIEDRKRKAVESQKRNAEQHRQRELERAKKKLIAENEQKERDIRRKNIERQRIEDIRKSEKNRIKNAEQQRQLELKKAEQKRIDDRKRKAEESQKLIAEQHRQRELEKVEKKLIEEKEQKAKEAFEKRELEIKKKEIFFVNYESRFNGNEGSYPFLKFPNRKCVVRSYRNGATKRRGYKEESFQKTIESYFSKHFIVAGDIRINTGKETRPFEPDIALINNFSDKNIRIDIEIDEPYSGISRQATHCIDDDKNRDLYFTDRGWIVIRFSEHQVHTMELGCIKYIANVIQSIDARFTLDKEIKELKEEKKWDIVQAQKWEKERYRENYLNHEFQEVAEKIETTKKSLDEQEIKEENLVESTSLGKVEETSKIGFNGRNKHNRDKRIKFYPEPHIYTIDRVPVQSASTIVSRFFPEFDIEYWSRKKAPQLNMTSITVKKMWQQKGKNARDKGTFVHEQIEKYFLNEKYEKTEEFYQFDQFINDHNLNIYRTEWRIFCEDYNFAGTIDLVVKNNDGSYHIYDWKRSKKVINEYNGTPITKNKWQNGIGKLSHLDDTSYNRYSLQQNMYRYILETKYGISISKIYLVIIHPIYKRYYKVEVPRMQKETKFMLKTLK